jgi:hypothetical protein
MGNLDCFVHFTDLQNRTKPWSERNNVQPVVANPVMVIAGLIFRYTHDFGNPTAVYRVSCHRKSTEAITTSMNCAVNFVDIFKSGDCDHQYKWCFTFCSASQHHLLYYTTLCEPGENHITETNYKNRNVRGRRQMVRNKIPPKLLSGNAI